MIASRNRALNLRQTSSGTLLAGLRILCAQTALPQRPREALFDRADEARPPAADPPIAPPHVGEEFAAARSVLFGKSYALHRIK